MEKLEAWGLVENTLLIFTTDNGSAKGSRVFNAGMKAGKGSTHQGGSRVPLFFRLPGVTEPGRDLDQLARHIDIFPTFAELAGADVSALGLEGRSLIPLLKDGNEEWPDRKLFFHVGRWPKTGASGKFGEGDPNPDSHKYKKFAVRSEKWRLVGQDSLYDIENDPGEKVNVISSHPEVAKELQKAYEAFWEEARPLMVNEDASLDVEKPFEANYLRQKADGGIANWVAPEL